MNSKKGEKKYYATIDENGQFLLDGGNFIEVYTLKSSAEYWKPRNGVHRYKVIAVNVIPVKK